ncbi:Hypothetical predicted protein [Pelobates cultripes]|uniref:Uncharacterized protein n=1 Tax=Pelobates cultripes TaxID=61616 RepID=A0AAD1RCZ8_PELCU|nr:Hypothetical predicted protein [Pelobates cultripes]
MFQSTINGHIWKRKPPRVAQNSMGLPYDRGGLGLPIIRGYYRATTLAQSIRLLQPKNAGFQPLWLELENACLRPYDLTHSLWTHSYPPPTTKPKLRCTEFQIRSWVSWGKHIVGTATLLRSAPVETLGALSTDLSLKTWADKGIARVGDLCEGSEIIPFPTLQQKYSLSTRDMFLYLRVKSVLLTALNRGLDPNPQGALQPQQILSHTMLRHHPPRPYCRETFLYDQMGGGTGNFDSFSTMA